MKRLILVIFSWCCYTLIIAQPILSENFTVLPADWTYSPLVGETGAWKDGGVYATCTPILSTSSELTSPAFDVSSLKKPTLHFMYSIFCPSSTVNSDFDVQVSSDGSNFSSLLVLSDENSKLQASEVEIPKNTKHIKFVAHSLATNTTFRLNEVLILEETPFAFQQFSYPELIYDMDADGNFDLLYNNYADGTNLVEQTINFNTSPLTDTIFPSNTRITHIGNLNNDMLPDFFGEPTDWNENGYAYINNSGAYEYLKTEYANWDQNIDGKPDLFVRPDSYNAYYKWLLMLAKNNNEYAYQIPDIVSYSDYLATPDYSAWDISDSTSIRMGSPSAVLLPSGGMNNSIGKLCCSNLTIDVSPSSEEMDVDKNGLPDLIVADLGAVYYNYGDGKYVSAYLGGTLTPKDFNNDFIPDFVVYDESSKKVSVMIYEGSGNFRSEVLMENMALDPMIFCYDFDQDNDIDILLPFSFIGNELGTFMSVCENDGTGHFTMHENAYVGKEWEFKECKDFDNDGYYDLLMLNRPIDETSSLFILKGKENFEFEALDEQICPGGGFSGNYASGDLYHAEDIDNDGLYEIWRNDFSGAAMGYDIYQCKSTNPNTRPSKMDAPTVIYDASNNHVEISWNTGSDAESSTCDLSYALRVGSAPGTCDLVFAHANSEGIRRGFLRGNMRSNLNKIYNVSSWPEGTCYVSIQAIDPQSKGSVWSDETTFEKTKLSAEFSILSLCDSLSKDDSYIPISSDVTETYTVDSVLISLKGQVNASYTYAWDFGCDAVELSKKDDGNYTITYNTGGFKEINLSITDQEGKTFFYKKDLLVLPNKLIETSTDYSAFSDYDADGDQDAAMGDGLYEHTAPGDFEKIGKIFNLSLLLSDPFFLDYENDGDLDMFYNDISGHYSGQKNYLLNTGDMNFSIHANQPVDAPYTYPVMADYSHNGYFDYTPYATNDGSYTKDITSISTDFFPTDAEGYIYDKRTFVLDWNKDGWLDFASQTVWTPLPYSGTTEKYLPHVVLSDAGNSLDMDNVIYFDMPLMLDIVAVEDMDNDGDYDLICRKNSDLLHLFLNDGNNKFNFGIDLIVPEGTYNNFLFLDLDNNGFKDLLYDDGIIYFEKDLITRTRKSPVPFYRLNDKTQLIEMTGDSTPDLPHMSLQNLAKISNEKPRTPNNIFASQSDSSLLILWEDASDAETPAVQLRYNLSVKKKGEAGAGSYIISPHNEGMQEAAFLPGKQYIHANQFEIPIKYLPIGEYEIQLQCIDLWNEMSDFSDVYTIGIAAAPVFELPTDVCFNTSASIVYKGTTGSTINWDFDGGSIESGSGYGPYEVKWNTSGVKKITVSVDDADFNSSILVHPETHSSFSMAEQIVAGIPAKINIHQALTSDMDFSWTELDGLAKFTVGDSIGTITFNNEGSINLGLSITKGSCASTLYSESLSILEAFPTAEIDIVSNDAATAKNKITWDSGNWPAHATKVAILKEGNSLNQFDTLAVVDADDQMYIDTESQPQVQSERYRLVLQDDFQNTGKPGEIHQTVHVAINTALGSGYNLIWNLYQGKEIATYRILRGTDENSMLEIAQLSGAKQSYSDLTPTAGENLYQVQIIPSSSAKKGVLNMSKGENDIYSNIADNTDAVTITAATSIKIMAVEDVLELNEIQTELHFFVDILPGNTSLQTVQWEIVSGNNLASIQTTGTLSRTDISGGLVKIRATSIDGSNLYDEVDVNVQSLITTYIVNTTANPAEGGTVIGAGTYNENTELSLNATPNSGYDFINWTVEGVEVSGDANYTFMVDADVNVEANFLLKPTTSEVTFQVDMQNETVTADGVFIRGNFNDWGESIQLDKGSDEVYTTTLSLEKNTQVDYKFINGKTAGGDWNWESVSGSCTDEWNNRILQVPDSDYTVPLVCYNSCEICVLLSEYIISAQVLPLGAGTVAGTGTYLADETVTLSAAANATYEFVNWTHDETSLSTATSYDITVTEDYEVTANFQLIPEPSDNLILNPQFDNELNDWGTNVTSENGSIEAIDNVAKVTILQEATNAWEIQLMQGGIPLNKEECYQFTFDAKSSVNQSPGFSLGQNGGSYTTYFGSAFDLEADWKTYTYNFTMTFDTDVQSRLAFDLGHQDGEIYFDNFELLIVDCSVSYEITTTLNPAEGGTTSGSGSYEEGAAVSLNAVANTGYDFVNWTKNDVEVSTNASYTFTATEDANYVANFALQSTVTYTINASASPAEGGTITGAGTYDENTELSLSATANTGYDFVNWTKDDAEVSTNASYTFTAIEDASFVANFTPQITGVDITFQVDMQNEEVSANGVHLLGNYGNLDISGPENAVLMNADGTIYTATLTLNPNDEIQYKFVNGTADEYSKYENNNDPACTGQDNYRIFTVPSNAETLPLVCFNSCSECSSSSDGMSNTSFGQSIQLYPNPSTGMFVIEGLPEMEASIKVYSVDGKQLILFQTAHTSSVEMNMDNLKEGIYTIVIQSDTELISKKLILMND